MNISARVENSKDRHQVILQTNDTTHSISILPRLDGFGSSANGGELLFLALATCYCNDIYREAAKRGLSIDFVTVEVKGQFGGVGDPATNVTYQATVKAQATEEEIRALMLHTDTVAEIQNTLRVGTEVSLDSITAIAS